MSEFGDWPPELLARVIKSMAPERVCRTCGEPSRRIVNNRFMWDRQPALAAHIRAQRIAAGYSLGDVDGWFGFNAGAAHWERTDKSGASIPTPDIWPTLKERLALSDQFDDMIYGGNLAEYVTDNGQVLAPSEQRTGGTGYDRGGGPPAVANRVKASRLAPDRFTDCGHDDYRPGVVLDPFGMGGTAEVAQALGRDGIEIIDDADPQMVAGESL